MAYTWLHKNLEGEAGKVRLTIEVVNAVEGDDVDGEIGVEVEEGAPRSTPSLHKSTLDVRHGLAEDEKQRGRSSLVTSGSHQ
jgi:hypothetical protein